jgi:hypothetical protein
VNAIAISELDREKTWSEARDPASLTVMLATDCMTKCPVTSADMDAACLACSSIIILLVVAADCRPRM